MDLGGASEPVTNDIPQLLARRRRKAWLKSVVSWARAVVSRFQSWMLSPCFHLPRPPNRPTCGWEKKPWRFRPRARHAPMLTQQCRSFPCLFADRHVRLQALDQQPPVELQNERFGQKQPEHVKPELAVHVAQDGAKGDQFPSGVRKFLAVGIGH